MRMSMDVLLKQAQNEIAATCRRDVTLGPRQHLDLLDPETNNLFLTRPPMTFITRKFAPSYSCTGFIERHPLESAVIRCAIHRKLIWGNQQTSDQAACLYLDSSQPYLEEHPEQQSCF
jgi:hypothetical protein